MRDAIAAKFVLEFFKELAKSPCEYQRAFQGGRFEVERHDPSAVKGLCFLSDVGQVDIEGHASSRGSDTE